MRKYLTNIRRHRGIRHAEKIEFLLRLKTLLQHGMTLSESILFLLKYLSVSDPTFKKDIETTVRAGARCYQILDVLGFPKSVVMQIYFAEQYGNLVHSLNHVYDYMKQNDQAKKRMLKTLQYPCVLFIILVSMLMMINQFILPQFQSMYLMMQVEISPLQQVITQMIMYLPQWLLVICVVSCSVFMLLYVFYKRQNIERKLHILRKLPFIRHYFILFNTFHIASQFALFNRSGVSVQSIIQNYEQYADNTFFNYLGTVMKTKLLSGMGLPDVFESLKLFEKDFIAFIRQGEQNGKLEMELNLYSEIILRKIQTRLTRQIKCIQPVVFGLLALLIIALYLVIMLPVFDMMQTIK